MSKKLLLRTTLAILLAMSFSIWPQMSVLAGSGSVTVTKYDAHGNTVKTQTLTWEQMRDGYLGLPVYGDGVTHYYCEGPNFDEARTSESLWDPTETGNIDSRDYGAAMGTDIKDLCELVGGMSPGDTVTTKASDGWSRTWDYENVYDPDPRLGRIVLTWYTKDAQETNSGYVPNDYSVGMRLLFFTEITDSSGRRVFGDYDAHETMPENRWYYYSDGQYWPTTSGMSGKYINQIAIRPPKMVSCDDSGNTKESFAPGETVYVKGQGLTANGNYKLWVQPEPALWAASVRGDTVPGATVPGPMNSGDDPSDAQESVTADASGDFPPTAVWDIPSSAAAGTTYDIVADNQGTGTGSVIGTFDNTDGADSPGFQGFTVEGEPVPTAPYWDLNADHVCNIADAVLIGLQWDKTGTPGWIKEDLNEDGYINLGDIVRMGSFWLETW